MHAVPVTGAVEMRERHIHRNFTNVQRFVDDHVVGPAALTVGFIRHPAPACDDLVAHVAAKLDGHARTHQRHDAMNTEFRGLDDGPFTAISFQRREVQRRRRRRRIDMHRCHAMQGVVAHFTQRPRSGAIGHDEFFAASRTQYGSQVMFVSGA